MLVRTDTLRPWAGEPIGDIKYPTSIEQLWTDDALRAIGLARPVPFATPDGQVATGDPTYVVSDDGSVHESYTTQAVPADRPSIPKALLRDRLTDEQRAVAISLMTADQRARWYNPDYPLIYLDDPEMTAVMKALGLDPTHFLAP